jgi:hypothetical protein
MSEGFTEAREVEFCGMIVKYTRDVVYNNVDIHVYRICCGLNI